LSNDTNFSSISLIVLYFPLIFKKMQCQAFYLNLIEMPAGSDVSKKRLLLIEKYIIAKNNMKYISE